MDVLNLEPMLSIANEPDSKDRFDSWVEQKDIIPFLEKEIDDEDIIIYAALAHFFIHALLIENIEISETSIEDLQKWDHNPYSGWGLVVSGDDAWIEGPLESSSSDILRKGEQILFARSFDGVASRSRYFEVEQRICHLLDLHYMEERNAWCKLDQFGDIQDVIKIIELDDLPNNESGTIITMNRELLGKYTCAGDLVLCRTFDFTRFKKGGFSGWDHKKERGRFGNDKDIFGSVVVQPGYGSYSRGVQVKNISISKEKVVNSVWGRPISDEPKKYATFIAHDWKNNRIADISCDPSSIANYFTESDLPFTMTPAFFRPEVLLKYKSDREKYSLEDRSITCRGSWYLETFDVNEVGQVHTYLVYLSRLPYEEQLHWKQYNEKPKARLSKRAIANDFEGQFYDEYNPLMSLKGKLEDLHSRKVFWWTLRDDNAIKKVNYPYTSSFDEWADEFLNLDQLIVEGFEEKALRQKAAKLGRSSDSKLRPLKLIEECLIGLGYEADHSHEIMSPFHDVHNLRSILKGHASGTEAQDFKKQALQQFGTYRRHFESVCARCDESLEILIEALDK